LEKIIGCCDLGVGRITSRTGSAINACLFNLNNVLEQDHRAIKRRVRASQHFRSFWGAWRTIAGYEAIHIIRKGQARQSAPGGMAILLHRFILGLFAATN
jgi:DDE domain